MQKKIHKVGIILDPKFGIKLISLLKRMHVWILDSKSNRELIERHKIELEKLWNKTDINDPFDLGISLIPTDYYNCDDNFIELLEEIDDHHGKYHHNPPWSVLEVYGVKLSPTIENVLLEDFNVKRIDEKDDSFICFKK